MSGGLREQDIVDFCERFRAESSWPGVSEGGKAALGHVHVARLLRLSRKRIPSVNCLLGKISCRGQLRPQLVKYRKTARATYAVASRIHLPSLVPEPRQVGREQSRPQAPLGRKLGSRLMYLLPKRGVDEKATANNNEVPPPRTNTRPIRRILRKDIEMDTANALSSSACSDRHHHTKEMPPTSMETRYAEGRDAIQRTKRGGTRRPESGGRGAAITSQIALRCLLAWAVSLAMLATIWQLGGDEGVAGLAHGFPVCSLSALRRKKLFC